MPGQAGSESSACLVELKEREEVSSALPGAAGGVIKTPRPICQSPVDSGRVGNLGMAHPGGDL